MVRYARIKLTLTPETPPSGRDWRKNYGSTGSTWFHESWNTNSPVKTLVLGYGSIGSITFRFINL